MINYNSTTQKTDKYAKNKQTYNYVIVENQTVQKAKIKLAVPSHMPLHKK